MSTRRRPVVADHLPRPIGPYSPAVTYEDQVAALLLPGLRVEIDAVAYTP